MPFGGRTIGRAIVEPARDHEALSSVISPRGIKFGSLGTFQPAFGLMVPLSVDSIRRGRMDAEQYRVTLGLMQDEQECKELADRKGKGYA
jgi:hypothetical protein